MRLRNGPHGYGAVTKVLHWLTVLAIVAQFAMGWAMDLDDGADRQDDLLDAEADRLADAAEGRGEAAEERAEAEIEAREDALDAAEDDEASRLFTDVVTGDAFGDGLSLPEVHVLLGLLVLALGVVRIVWRRTTPLPPWAEHLSAGERRFEGLLEKALLALLVVVPVSGLLLVGAGTDWLPLHVAAQIAFLAAVAGHVGLVLRHTVLRRNRHLLRML
ncbi:cytochrome b/b6 domain-containing protein [Blastococcus haudaquaticus]|uniref:Cytochrome b561 n=1 Tax=Blastococcus haudaquaticus TaxID=1938745 RepID=A0A286GQQ7_9ACTN|nr:cytochrome b/b6 domain-containing protein [Blastococcus haudaquaticus]SOD97832.1 Cytochrome b561 [Blastococcus haudaquaticus]